MITRRATITTKASLKALTKVRYRNESADLIKLSTLTKSLSTATETNSYFHQNRVKSKQVDSFPDYGSSRDRNGRSLGYGEISYESRNEHGGNGGGGYERGLNPWYGGNRGRMNVEVNSGDGYGNWGSRVNGEVNSGDGYGPNVGGVSNWGGSGNGNLNRSGGQCSQNSSFQNNRVGNRKQMWDQNRWSRDNDQQQPRNSNERQRPVCARDITSGQYHPIQEAYYPVRDLNSGAYGNNGAAGHFQQNQDGLSHMNNVPYGHRYQSGANVGGFHPDGQWCSSRINNSSVSNIGQHQSQAGKNNFAQTVGAYQHTVMQQNGHDGSWPINPYQYQTSSASGYQQNPGRNMMYDGFNVASPLQSNSNGPQPTTSSQVSDYSSPEQNVVGSLENDQIRGTVEELHNFMEEGKLEEAVEVLELLEKNEQRLIPERDLSTALKLIQACGEEEADREAKVVYKHLVKLMSPLTISTYNKILDMLLKCGCIEEAYSVFNDITEKNLTSWDTMIRGLVKNNLGEEAIDIFTEFKNLRLEPDSKIFLGVFSACGVVGDVAEGMLHFESMSKQFGIVLSMKHYVSIVEMLGNAGHLENALEFIETMPVKPSVDVWETMMHVCRVQGNKELGDRCAEIVEKLDPSRLSEQSKAGLIPLKASDLEKEKKKKKRQYLLEARSKIHEYRAGDTSHPENDRIYALLRGLKTQMKEAGYNPDFRCVLHDIDPEMKEEALLAHSERLAAAYGFITTAARQPIRVIKNLRVCIDCHNALKIISDLVGRELIMRDAKRFHHFKGGVCSCKDYW